LLVSGGSLGPGRPAPAASKAENMKPVRQRRRPRESSGLRRSGVTVAQKKNPAEGRGSEGNRRSGERR